MNLDIAKGYILTIASGTVLLALLLLVILQAQNRAEFSLYGKNISIRLKEDGTATGGINTAALMICSAVGGLMTAVLGWLTLRGLRSLRKGRRQKELDALAKSLRTKQSQEESAIGDE